MAEPRPAALPPAERTIGQLVAESIRFYGEHFWPSLRLGLAPAMISLTTLPRMDPRAASRYFLTGETFDATTAARIGLVTEAVDDIDAGTLAVLAALRACSPQGLRETKPLLTAGILDAFEARAEALAEQSARLFGTDEAVEGMSAFLAKRPPSWAAG